MVSDFFFTQARLFLFQLFRISSKLKLCAFQMTPWSTERSEKILKNAKPKVNTKSDFEVCFQLNVLNSFSWLILF